MVTGLNDAKHEKHQRKTFRRPDDPSEPSSGNGSWKFKKNFMKKAPELKPQTYLIEKPSSSIFFDESPLKKEPESITTLPLTYLNNK